MKEEKEGPCRSGDDGCGAATGEREQAGESTDAATGGAPVRCHLCAQVRVGKNKRFRRGRSLRYHMLEKHCASGLSPAERVAFADEACAAACVFSESLAVGGAAVAAEGLRGDASRSAPPPAWVKAASEGDVVSLRALRAATREWDWDSRDRHGSTAEQYAAGAGQLECTQYCLELRFEHCPLHHSLLLRPGGRAPEAAGRAEPVCLCREQLSRRRDGRNALHWAARNGRREMIEFLVTQAGFEVDQAAFDGTTALMYSVFGAHHEAAALLVALGAQPALRNSWDCDLACWIAISKSRDRAAVAATAAWVEAMLGTGCFARSQKEGRTALHKAAYSGQEALVNWLDDRGLIDSAARARIDLAGQTASDLARLAGLDQLALRLSPCLPPILPAPQALPGG
jgi:ankyrin repeat protein